MKTLGLDIGSANTKGVLFDQRRQKILGWRVKPTDMRPKEAAAFIIRSLAKGNRAIPIVTCGIGRHLIPNTKSITEITALAKGINFLFPKVRTVIDIGGEDLKVIRVDQNGKVVDFVMNDRCASGTGRFFMNLAKALKIDFRTFEKEVLSAKNPVLISHLCVVMAESEVLSKVYEGIDLGNVLAGVCTAVARRILSLASGLKIEKEIALTGGVSQNRAMQKALTLAFQEEVLVPKNPLLVAALGASLAR